MPLDFIDKAILGGVGIALLAGPLGSIIVWRRMANFGDAMSHSTLLGVAIAMLFNLHIYLGLFIVCILSAAALANFITQKQLANETLLSIFAQVILATGLLAATFQEGLRIDLLGYLYGDILAIDNTDLWWILAANVLVLTSIFMLWRSLLSMIIHEDLARVEGVPVNFVKWVLMILMAAIFTVAMKLVGALLITALLIIPASAARQLAKSPESMVILASIIGMCSVVLGISLSTLKDIPTGPAIVMVIFLFFLLSIGFSRVLVFYQQKNNVN